MPIKQYRKHRSAEGRDVPLRPRFLLNTSIKTSSDLTVNPKLSVRTLLTFFGGKKTLRSPSSTRFSIRALAAATSGRIRHVIQISNVQERGKNLTAVMHIHR